MYNTILKSFFMPELPECKIMSDYINQNCSNKNFIRISNVEKGNISNEFLSSNFTISSDTNGKEIIVSLKFDDKIINVYIFMGMSGNWKWVDTKDWFDTKYCRLKFDSEDGKSLLLYGGYMGPKYKIGEKFSGTKRGPDPLKQFDEFKENILNNLDKKDFDKPISEVLMNQRYFNGIGAYLNAEIIGRLDFDPFKNFNLLSNKELDDLFIMITTCCDESYSHGGGELISWINPIGIGNINECIKFYGNKKDCIRQKFGKRNIWIQKKFKKNSS